MGRRGEAAGASEAARWKGRRFWKKLHLLCPKSLENTFQMVGLMPKSSESRALPLAC